ncbi:hypothetical protein LSM04_008823 [Trypanosoma melophagium]|uniref:uncharacterized protein n=1 Tax=Trypanosoma melophagium TaxID=715481 RepID=UPI00351A03F1|nr:hypothetical protein LSM04_008823 [Trypanosoma melophagium]
MNVEREPVTSAVVGDSLGKNDIDGKFEKPKITEWKKKTCDIGCIKRYLYPRLYYSSLAKMQALLRAETFLLWPLILLLFSVVWQWAMVVENTFHVIQRMRVWLAKLRSGKRC